jgi:hypothetical protein
MEIGFMLGTKRQKRRLYIQNRLYAWNKLVEVPGLSDFVLKSGISPRFPSAQPSADARGTFL